ncbi:Inorganic pyrophosphatase 3 [Symbiodinium microadriaticum]|uniref:Inorganic pyrophosphatase 3 n=1 Tax=Symbiodinium microadriaticum TaxID=2951 RepID=A0A1Q9DPG6_SYMMI|nr:Inorganic pyrophosphatase 3 [Symbiodinium microadriaticum]
MTAPLKAASAPLRRLLVWDYDWSLINTNSDTFVVEKLRPELMARFDSPCSGGWTALMDRQMKVPVFEENLLAVRRAAEAEAAQIVLSDANTVFIEAFLQSAGLRSCFSEIITNAAEFNSDGCLRVRPFHEGPPHGCPLCPDNLCKGLVLRRLLADYQPQRVLYVGDGGGDFCPACELRKEDVLLCRAPPSPPLTRFGLKRRLEGPPEVKQDGSAAKVVARVTEWQSGEDVLAAITDFLV